MSCRLQIGGGYEQPLCTTVDGMALPLRASYFKAGGANFLIRRKDGFNETGVLRQYEI